MKLKNLYLIGASILACTLFNSCMSRWVYNAAIPEKSIDYYIKTSDVGRGDYIFHDANGYYIRMTQRRLEDGRHMFYAFPVVCSYREKEKGDSDGLVTVQVPASFAHYLMGESGTSSPAWLKPCPQYSFSKLTPCGKVVRLPETSVTHKFATKHELSSREKVNQAASYFIIGWTVDLTISGIGTAFTAVGAPFILFFNPVGLFLEDNVRYNLPDNRIVPAYDMTGNNSPIDIASQQKQKTTTTTKKTSSPSKPPKEDKPTDNTTEEPIETPTIRVTPREPHTT